MSNRKIKRETDNFQQLEGDPSNLDTQLNELMELLEKSELDRSTVNQMREKFDKATNTAALNHEKINADKAADQLENVSRSEMLNNLQFFLSKHEFNSKQSKQYLFRIRLKKLTMGIISVLLIILGFAMIVMPAPPYFEMFTLFYFTENDGITLMDLISLLIVLSGIYLLIRTMLPELQKRY